ncbi:adenylate kinase, partial [Kappamyces sp. JEL0680]
MESIVVGMTFSKPQDPLEYIESCVKRIRDNDLLSNHPAHPRIRWSTFLPALPAISPEKTKPALGRTDIRRREAAVPVLHPYKRQILDNPVLVKQQQAALPAIQTQEISMTSKAWKNIVFVLGGSGKGTNCEKLAKEFQYAHLSAGDLLREEVAKSTPIGKEIDKLMKEGQIVPTCSFETLERRLLERGKTSGRSDDNIDTIKKRFVTFQEHSAPVIEYYQKRGKCTVIDSEQTVDQVYELARKVFQAPCPLNYNNLVFVLGGPGAGKGTQCAKIVETYKYKHISTGDLLRREVENQTPVGLQVSSYLSNGKMAPMDIILYLLREEVAKNTDAVGILIDGFPRAMDQALEFERTIGAPRAIMSFHCPLDVLQERLLERGKTSGRSDDNVATITKRFQTFQEESMPVITYYSDIGKCIKIMGTSDPETVFANLQKQFSFASPDSKPALVVSGPSGTGKSTLLNRLFAKYPSVFGFSVSHTTRSPRHGETHGQSYHFVSHETFKAMETNEQFIETNEFSGNFYGTSKDAIKAIQNANKICVLDLDIAGVKAMKSIGLPAYFVFIEPPSIAQLEARLRARNSETPASLAMRLNTAKEAMDYA